MDAIVNLLNNPIQEIHALRKNAKTEKNLKAIDKWEKKFIEFQDKVIQRSKLNKIDTAIVETAIKDAQKLINNLMCGELWKNYAVENQKELIESLNDLELLKNEIRSLKKELKLSKDKENELSKLLENRVDKSVIKEIQEKYEQKFLELKQNHQQNQQNLSMVALTPLSDEHSENILDFICENNKILDRAKKVKETKKNIIYEVVKENIDSVKNDKRTKPAVRKNTKLHVLVSKNTDSENDDVET